MSFNAPLSIGLSRGVASSLVGPGYADAPTFEGLILNGNFLTTDPIDGSLAWEPLDFGGGAGGWTILGDGTATYSKANTAHEGIQMNFDLITGRDYNLKIDLSILAGNGAGAGIAWDGQGGIASASSTTTGLVDVTFTATGTSGRIRIRTRVANSTQHNLNLSLVGVYLLPL